MKSHIIIERQFKKIGMMTREVFDIKFPNQSTTMDEIGMVKIEDKWYIMESKL